MRIDLGNALSGALGKNLHFVEMKKNIFGQNSLEGVFGTCLDTPRNVFDFFQKLMYFLGG